MKKNRNSLLISILLGMILLMSFSCNQSNEKNQLVYSEGNKKIELLFEGGNKFLILDNPTKAKFVTKNIDNQHFLIVGPGISRNTENNSEYRWIITAPKESLEDGKLKIRVWEVIENGEDLNAEFLVEVKAAE